MKRREALSLALNLSWTMLFSLLVPLLLGIWLDKQVGHPASVHPDWDAGGSTRSHGGRGPDGAEDVPTQPER